MFMYVVLLTGGLAAGKDTVSSYLAGLGATILDLDLIAKEAQTEEPVLEQIKAEFGRDIVDAEGMLDRPLLAQRAFADREHADRLNAICWPPVMERVANYILGNTCQPMEHGALLVVQVPLLVEALGLLDLADEIIAVIADENIRFKRALARGMDSEDVRNRLALQADDKQRAAISDTVFINNGSLKELEDQIRAWYDDRIAGRLF
jgi:dephospho-CoA kinase